MVRSGDGRDLRGVVNVLGHGGVELILDGKSVCACPRCGHLGTGGEAKAR